MNRIKSIALVFCFLTGYLSIYGQGNDSKLKDIIDRINTETPIENGCTSKTLSLEDCTFNYSLKCGGDIYNISFKTKDIGRVYLDKADYNDEFETLFLECKKGKNCITSDSDRIPPSPVFPIKLAEDENSSLGEDAEIVLNAFIENCK